MVESAKVTCVPVGGQEHMRRIEESVPIKRKRMSPDDRDMMTSRKYGGDQASPILLLRGGKVNKNKFELSWAKFSQHWS